MRVMIFAAAMMLGACVGKPALEDEKLSLTDFNLEEFFDGRVVAKGQFQDVFGTVRRRFDVVVTGKWDGETLTLVEDFVYAEGTTEQRIWRLKKTGPIVADQTWTGSADGVLGVAKGEERGDTFNWKYKIDLPVPDGTLRVNFDDWMWDMGGDRVLNRAYMKKYGVDIGEVLITFEKP
ncbi:DUF3833 domain-containing protein [Sulfitobacter guttiformis]|uniref:Uncharacterized protein DUF3833 n=1 Tax=Sulfitobacter guttiformis TaxID=74349 RepID=A0A420DQK1_9RHOB|nr:DUF3833 domain-containing protein [Sulfitobacter guttiformis]RKE96458.1 uncharacterized protein DUF3833 [Sulfitobacter guttiformis]